MGTEKPVIGVLSNTKVIDGKPSQEVGEKYINALTETTNCLPLVIPSSLKNNDEYIEIFKTLWGEKEPSYQGEFYSFEPIQFAPKPVQIPGPDIWVGGQSRAAIRRAAKLGNAWHPVGANPASPLEPEEMVEEIAYLETYCESLNRDPSEVTVVLKAPIYDKENNYGGKRRRFSG